MVPRRIFAHESHPPRRFEAAEATRYYGLVRDALFDQATYAALGYCNQPPKQVGERVTAMEVLGKVHKLAEEYGLWTHPRSNSVAQGINLFQAMVTNYLMMNTNWNHTRTPCGFLIASTESGVHKAAFADMKGYLNDIDRAGYDGIDFPWFGEPGRNRDASDLEKVYDAVSKIHMNMDDRWNNLRSSSRSLNVDELETQCAALGARKLTRGEKKEFENTSRRNNPNTADAAAPGGQGGGNKRRQGAAWQQQQQQQQQPPPFRPSHVPYHGQQQQQQQILPPHQQGAAVYYTQQQQGPPPNAPGGGAARR
jgi:hypothetical protein